MTDGPSRAPARAMLKAIGFNDEDLAKPLIGVATTWIETMPCNYNQRELAQYVKEGIREAGGTPMEFNTISRFGRGRDGDGGDARLAGEPGSDNGLDRDGGARAFLRRTGSAGGLRQDAPRRGDGAGSAEPAGSRLLQRVDSAGTHRRERHHDSGCLRGGWRSRRREDR